MSPSAHMAKALNTPWTGNSPWQGRHTHHHTDTSTEWKSISVLWFWLPTHRLDFGITGGEKTRPKTPTQTLKDSCWVINCLWCWTDAENRPFLNNLFHVQCKISAALQKKRHAWVIKFKVIELIWKLNQTNPNHLHLPSILFYKTDKWRSENNIH